VIDNTNSDGSDQIIAKEFPNVILIRNKQNLGFCKANNIGIKYSKGDIVVLLNNDTFVHDNWLIEIVKAINSPYVGIVGCKLLHPNGKIIQSCGCKEIFPGYRVHITAGLTTDEFKIEKEFESDYIPKITPSTPLTGSTLLKVSQYGLYMFLPDKNSWILYACLFLLSLGLVSYIIPGYRRQKVKEGIDVNYEKCNICLA